jgi:Na+/melibiose symporter-like transporter
MQQLTARTMWLFALGQLGWAMLVGLIANWLVYVYQPDQTAIEAGQTVFIPQGLAVLGIITIVGAITALSRVFDAVTDPWIANLSDRSRNPRGRRIPFMKIAAVPLAVTTFLVFYAPVSEVSHWNSIWLLVMLLLFYLFLTLYVTPYNALIPELGKTKQDRVNISTCISLTFIIGTSVAFFAPIIWGMLEPLFGRVTAIQLTFAGMSLLALICLLIPVFTINERHFIAAKPSEGALFSSLISTFRNRNFAIFVRSDILYWVALTMFQTGLPFFVVALLGLQESMTALLFVLMTALSLLFYIPINRLAGKLGKKRLVLVAFFLFSLVYVVTGIGGWFGISGIVYGIVIAVMASVPIAILGILPQAMVADLAHIDAIDTGENREGMFFAARTFAFKLGQSLALLLFTALATIDPASGSGYRLAAFSAAILCFVGALALLAYQEKEMNQRLE